MIPFESFWCHYTSLISNQCLAKRKLHYKSNDHFLLEDKKISSGFFRGTRKKPRPETSGSGQVQPDLATSGQVSFEHSQAFYTLVPVIRTVCNPSWYGKAFPVSNPLTIRSCLLSIVGIVAVRQRYIRVVNMSSSFLH